MKKETVENIIRHEFKKTPYHVTNIIWHAWEDDNTEAVIIVKEKFSWKKLYKRFSRLEEKLNLKYGIMLDCVNE